MRIQLRDENRITLDQRLVASDLAACLLDWDPAIVERRQTIVVENLFCELTGIDRAPRHLDQIAEALDAPPFGDGAELGVDEAIGEEGGGLGVHAFWLATLCLGADGIEVDEPRREERPRDLVQRRVHLPVELDLVVERAEDVGDGALLGEGR